jgi:hypothetical protein
LVLGLVVGRPTYQAFRYYFVEWPKTNKAKAGYHVYAVKLAKEMSKEINPQATFLLPRNTAAGDVNPNYTVMFLYDGQAGYAWLVDDENTLEATMNEAVQGRDVVHVVRWKTSKHTFADPKEVIPYYLEKHGDFVEKRSFEYFDIETYRLDELEADLADGPLAPTSKDFGGQLELTGFAYGDASGAEEPGTPSVAAGDMLWVRLRLRATAPIDKELKASVIVTDSAGHIVGQIDKLLLNNFLHQGSEDWEPGTEVDAYFLIPVDPASAPGDYRLGLAIYDADSLARLPSASGDAAQVVTLGSVGVRPDLSPPATEALGINLALDQPVADELTLLGLASSAVGETLRPGERASLALLDEVPSDDYRASLWVTQGDDAWPLTDSLPLAGVDYPASRWGVGQVVRGWFDGQVPLSIASGDYALEVHVIDTYEAPIAEVPLGTVRVQGWPRQFETPPMQNTLGANFSDRTGLLGYDVGIDHLTGDQEQGSVVVSLYWRALSEMDANYATFVHLLSETGQVVSQVDHVPGDGAFPTTGWLPGEIIVDEFVVPLPKDDMSASLQLEIGIYDTATGERLLVVDPRQMGDHILLPDRIPVGP